MGRPKKDSKQITIYFPVDQTALPIKRRPGQKAPTARHGPKLSSQKKTAGPAPAGSRRSGLSWRETVERRDAAWEVRRSASEKRYLASYLQVREWNRMKHALILNHTQDRVREVFARALESHQCSQGASDCRWEASEDLKVAFIDLETRGFLNIPSCRCKLCGEVASVEPEDIGCFPATPSQPVTWFGYGLLRAISFIKKTKGISIQGLIDMLDDGLNLLQEASGEKIALRSTQLSVAHAEFERLNSGPQQSGTASLQNDSTSSLVGQRTTLEGAHRTDDL